jgi:ABC-type transporter Mla MlaB component
MAATSPRTATVHISGQLVRADVPRLYAHTCALLDATSAEVLRCTVSGLTADVLAVDALAQVALAARRRGCGMELHGASQPLRGLASFMGVEDVLFGR